MKTIDFEVGLDGQVKMDVKGAVGQECKAMVAPFERALGGESVQLPKPELFQQQVQGQSAGAVR